MDVAQPSQKYCSTRCRKAASYLRTAQEWGRVRYCRTCGGPISDSLRGDSLYCSEACRGKHHRELPGKVEERREAYRQAAGLIVRDNCAHCGGPMPEGKNARASLLLEHLQYGGSPRPEGERPRRAQWTCR